MSVGGATFSVVKGEASSKPRGPLASHQARNWRRSLEKSCQWERGERFSNRWRSYVPKRRLTALARYATTAQVHNLRQFADDHRTATLLAFAYTFLATVHDGALDLFDALMRTAFSAATREGQQARLRTIHDLDAAAQVLSEACQVVLDETQDPATLLERIYLRVSAEQLRTAVTTVGELTRPPDDTYAQELLGRHLMMRLSSTFQRFVNLSMGYAIYMFERQYT